MVPLAMDDRLIQSRVDVGRSSLYLPKEATFIAERRALDHDQTGNAGRMNVLLIACHLFLSLAGHG